MLIEEAVTTSEAVSYTLVGVKGIRIAATTILLIRTG